MEVFFLFFLVFFYWKDCFSVLCSVWMPWNDFYVYVNLLPYTCGFFQGVWADCEVFCGQFGWCNVCVCVRVCVCMHVCVCVCETLYVCKWYVLYVLLTNLICLQMVCSVCFADKPYMSANGMSCKLCWQPCRETACSVHFADFNRVQSDLISNCLDGWCRHVLPLVGVSFYCICTLQVWSVHFVWGVGGGPGLPHWQGYMYEKSFEIRICLWQSGGPEVTMHGRVSVCLTPCRCASGMLRKFC